MRCYFMRRNGTVQVEDLNEGSDNDLIRQALTLFQTHDGYAGFEVWSGKRFVFRYTAATKTGERLLPEA